MIFDVCKTVYMSTRVTDTDVETLRMHLYNAELEHDIALGRTPDFRPLRLDPFLTYTDDRITIGIRRRTMSSGPDYYLTIDSNDKIFFTDGINNFNLPLEVDTVPLTESYSDC